MSETAEPVAVLGAGTMGRGIAQVAAAAGYETRLYDLSDEAVERGLEQVRANLDKGVARGKVTEGAREETLSRLQGSTDLAEAVADTGLVIEAVPEDLELKKNLFEEVAAAAPDDALLATNTSSLSVTAIASSVHSPERCLGMHFFNPPHIVRLLEIVRADQTSEESVSRARAVGTRMDREMIVVNDSPGFATSRLGLVLGLEAMRMVEQGVASAEEVDRAMEFGYRHPMGPLKLTDMVGLDVRLSIAQYLHAELGGEQFRPPQILKRMVRAGKLGRKSGQGFYSWGDV